MLKTIIIFLIFSRICLFLYAGNILGFTNNWDGPHYIYLSQHGYTNLGDEANFIVFLPFYPLIISIFNFLIGNSQLASLLVSNVLFVISGVFFYKLLRKTYTDKFSFFVVFLMAIFPTSYFFSSSYPESLFVLLFCLSFYFSQKNIVLSSFFSGLATLTRPFGILLWPALGLEALKSNKKVSRVGTLILFFVLSSSIYLAINYFVYGYPFAFQKILEGHWQKSFAPPWQGIYQSLRVAVLSGQWDSYRIFVGWGEAIASIVAWIFVPLAFYKKFKIKLSWAVYYLLGVILFTSTGFILSAPRYLLSLPPFFVILAKILKYRVLKIVWIIISIVLLFILTGVAASGQWAF